MIIAAAIILIILIIILGILVVPFHICLDLYNNGFKIRGNFKLTWMKIKLIQRDIPPKEEKEKPKEKKAKKETKFDVNRIPRIISLLVESWPYFERILNAFLKSTSFEKFHFDLAIGLGDPVNTAMINGYLWSAASLINLIPNTHFSIEPDFLKMRFDGYLTMDVKIRLLWVVIEFIRALTKKPVRMLIGELRKMRG